MYPRRPGWPDMRIWDVAPRILCRSHLVGYRHRSPLRASRGSRIQRVRLLSREPQIARLEAKPCSCPRPTTTKVKK